MNDTPLLPVNTALEKILSAFSPGPAESVTLLHAIGRVLAEDIVSTIDLPPFDNSSMDGFALNPADRPVSTDMPITLKVVADIPAGSQPSFTLIPGQAARIMTGAPVPEGADCVVPVEDTNFPYRETRERPDQVVIQHFPPAGGNIRPRGQDAKANQPLIKPGRILKPADAALAASLGYANLQMVRQPQVAILSTGDELAAPGTVLEPGKIYESNATLIGGLTAKAGGSPMLLGIARDEPGIIQDKLDEAVTSGVDLILTSAGVSVGAFDYVREVIESNGVLNLWRVNMRPGKPLMFGSYKGVPVIGLPGNPVSAFTGFMIFVVPVIERLLNLENPGRTYHKAILEQPIRSDGRESYFRAVITQGEQRLTARLSAHQGSANLLSIVKANGLLIVPAGVKSLPEGAEVDVWPFTDTILER